MISVLFNTPGSPIPNPVTNPSILPIIIPHPKSKASTNLTSIAAGFHTWLEQNNIRIPIGFSFPYPVTGPGADPSQAFSSIIAHEIAEVMTDPKPNFPPDPPEGNEGFTSLPPHLLDGEVADVCVFTVTRKIGNAFVEPYWSNDDNACIISTAQTGKTFFTEQAIPNENTAPDGVVFRQPFDVNPLHLSAIDPMHCVGFWLKRVVNAEAETTLNNRFTLHIEAQI